MESSRIKKVESEFLLEKLKALVVTDMQTEKDLPSTNPHIVEHVSLKGIESFLPPVQSKPFCFEKMWTRHSDCVDLIVSNCSNSSGLPSLDCTFDKLKCMEDSLSLWNKNTKIGNVEDTRVFEDPWIPNLPHEMILNHLPHYDPHLCVNRLISPNRQWIREDVAHIFPANVANLIYGITLGRISLDDSWFWRFNPTGHYLVKSGYKEYRRVVLSATSGSDKSMQHPDVWRRVWKSKLPGKLKHFVWRMLKEILLVCSRLAQKGLDVPPECPFCDLEDESTFHALLGCPALGDLWRRSGIPFVEESDEDIDLIRRNEWRFNNKDLPVAQILSQALDLWKDCLEICQVPNVASSETRFFSPWCPPPFLVLKLNVDASLKPGIHAGAGCVIRNEEGRVLTAAAFRVSESASAAELEVEAILRGLELAKDLRI
ncbi:Reverse transcriptase zinc-binding domain [Senna tora]|uniref:Reverse transcriptase zinc-binding domain n=1 Tax=Senna tora TaxID=362788 RepID=A0A834WR90_9FABA|nr:Reverse transcriptase zinc-binding domain [Senna tora]